MTEVRFFSDETGAHTGGRHFIVAGVALHAYRKWNRHDLLHAESVSLKGKKDWHQTTNLAQRTKYIEVVIGLDGLAGRVFYTHYVNTQKKHYWAHTRDTLAAAMKDFSADGMSIVCHQGLNAGTRDRLRKELQARGFKVAVQAASQEHLPEIRLADALCGYLGICRTEHPLIDRFPVVPGWFREVGSPSPGA